MARRLRLQFEGAVYHVINRGNYRRDLFETADKAKAFERALFETCERMAWRLYAYVLMPNHFHLAIQTPEANLVTGMHWLQTTFATRFNGYRQENGHLFQGRYRAMLVEPGAVLLRVVNYIHLNPVRAKIVPVEHFSRFRWSSLRHFLKTERASFFCAEDWLTSALLTDDSAGWLAYVQHLQRIAIGTDAESDLEAMTRGWAIGTPQWRRTLAEEFKQTKLSPEMTREESQALTEAQWNTTLRDLARQHGVNLSRATADAKSAPWKLELAARMRESTTAGHRWLCQTLCMGTPSSLRRMLCQRAQKAKP